MKRLIWKLFNILIKEKQTTIEAKKARLDSFPDPKNDYERSYFNYKLHKHNLINAFILNLLGILGIIVLMPVYFVNSLRVKEKKKTDAILLNKKNRIGDMYSSEGRFPDELCSEYCNLEVLNFEVFPSFTYGIITVRSLKYLMKNILKHPCAGYFNFRMVLNICGIERLLYEYSPKAIITSRAELNCFSSLITGFCEKHDVEYICFMHGVMLPNITISFVRFSRMYIWDEFYKKIFCWARCLPDQLRVYKPGIYNNPYVNSVDIRFDVLYAFSGSLEKDDKNLEEVKKMLISLSEHGYKCKVRPHPRWSDNEKIKNAFQNTDIIFEDATTINTKISIAETRIIIGTLSTVLTEAYYCGKIVLLDDVTYPEQYESIDQDMSFVYNFKSGLLSDYLENEVYSGRS